MASPVESAVQANARVPDAITLKEVGLHVGVRRFHASLFCSMFLLSMQYWANVQALPFVQDDVKTEFGLSDTWIATVSLATLGGSAVGVQLFGCISDVVGRRPVVLACSSMLFALGAMHLRVYSVAELLALRVVIGLPYGGLMVLIPAYMLEFVSDTSRGFLLGFLTLSWNVGSIISIEVFRNYRATLGWRGVMAIVQCPTFILGSALLMLMPESPRWLMTKGHEAEAQQVYNMIFESASLYGDIYVGRAPKVALDSKDKHGTMLAPAVSSCPSFAETLQRHGYMVAVCASLYTLVAGSHNAIWFWERRLLDLAAHETVSARIYQYTEVFGIVVVALASCGMDVIGRRPILFIAGAAQAVQFAMYAGGVPQGTAIATWVVAQGFSNGFWVALPVVMVESFPTVVRASLAGFCFACGRVAAILCPSLFAVLLAYPTAANTTLAVISLAFAFATFLLPRETMGRAVSDA